MRADWVPLSASALVVGAMALVFGALITPLEPGGSVGQTLRVVEQSGDRWLGMSVMYFFAAVTMTLGLPALLTLFVDKGRRTGLVAVGIFAVGVIGLAGFAMLLVFFRAVVVAAQLTTAEVETTTDDIGLTVFLNGWVACFYVGLLLVAVALFLSRKTPRWVPALLLLFVVFFPLTDALGRIGQVLHVMALAVAFTGIAISAVNLVARRTAARLPSY